MMNKTWIKVLGAGYFVGFFAVLVRLFLIQVVLREDYDSIRKDQYHTVIKIVPYRGKIISSDGMVLAESVSTFSLYGDPWYYWKEFHDNTPAVLAKILHIKNIWKKLANRKRRFVWLRRGLTLKEVALVNEIKRKIRSQWRHKGEKNRLFWFNFKEEYTRKYPSSYLAGQLIGFTGRIGFRDDGVGRSGVEAFYDQFLKGKETEIVVTRDGSKERRVLSSRALLPDSLSGLDIHLTINASLQDIVEEYLSEGVETAGGKRGMAIVMDPYTGKILAMANYPFFNPGKRTKENFQHWKNYCISYAFEPGSVIKPFIVAGAIDDGLLSLSEKFYTENGVYFYGNIFIHDHERHKWLTVPQIIKYSSNIGMTKIANELGMKEVYSILTRFGFSKRTGVDLPFEVAGEVRNWKEWYKADLANISFGQGMKATLLQLVTAMSVIANGGLLMRPYVVNEVVNREGDVVYKNDIDIKGRVLRGKTAKIMRRILRLVTEKGGTGVEAAIEGVPVAGKTGTAQKWVGKYTKNKYTASFVGFLPANKPKWVIGVVVDEPSKRIYGGTAAAPIFKEIAKELLRRTGMVSWGYKR